MIKRVTSTSKKQGWTYDSKEKLWYSYKVDFRVGGERIREDGFTTRKKADDFINEKRGTGREIKHGIARKPVGSPTLKSLFDARLNETPKGHGHNLRKRVFAYFLNLLPEGIKVAELKRSDLKKFPAARIQDKTNRDTFVKDETANRELTEIVSALNSAGFYYDELENYEAPKSARLKVSESRRERVISAQEQKKLIDYYARPKQSNESESQHRDRIRIGHEFEFAILTSSRRKEVVKLKWSDYFPEQNLLKITRWKTLKAKKNSVTNFSPVPKRVKEILEERRTLAADEYVFRAGGTGGAGYLKSLKAACKALGIPYGRFTEGGLTFHDTRHTFVSGLVSNNVDLETARELAGLSREMILRYAHSSAENKKRAVAVLDGERGVELLTEIYYRVSAGEMSLEDFIKAVLSL